MLKILREKAKRNRFKNINFFKYSGIDIVMPKSFAAENFTADNGNKIALSVSGAAETGRQIHLFLKNNKDIIFMTG